MVDERNKKEQPNLITKQCVAGAESLWEVKNCSFHSWQGDSFHVCCPDFSALSAGGIGLRCEKGGGGIKIR